MEISHLMVILLLIILLIAIGSEVIYKDDYAVLTGTISVQNGTGSASVNYPTGFNKNNCVPVAVGVSFGTSMLDVYIFGYRNERTTGAYLNNSTISITTSAIDNVGPTGTLNYRLVLMKIS